MFQVWLVEQNCPFDCRDDSVDVLPRRLSAHAQPAIVETGVAHPDPGSGAFLAPGSGMEKIQIQDPG
jgi:hypothetical protein